MSEKKPRRYQERAIESFCDWIETDSDLATIILPTGCGKTLTATWALQRVPGLKILWAAHREELIDQAYAEFIKAFPDAKISIEMAERRAEADSDIIVGSVPTLHRGRKNMEGFVPDIVVVDEWHHYSENNKTYHGLRERYSKAKFLGLTATPFRFSGGDLPLGRKLIEMDIGTAVAHNYLVPPKPEALKTDVSLANVKTRSGDFALNELSAAVNVDSRNKLIVQRLLQLIKDEGRKGILYAVDVAHSKAMFNLMKDKVRCAEVYGETPKDERRDMMERARNHEIDLICNNLVCLDDQTEILTVDGWRGINDIDSIQNVANYDKGNIWFAPPQKVFKRKRRKDERMVVLETRRRSIRVTEDHELLYRTNPNGIFFKKKASELCNKAIEIPVSGLGKPLEFNLPEIEKPKGTFSKRIGANSFNLRKANPGMSFDESKDIAEKEIRQTFELTPDECKFIGLMISDGTITSLQSDGTEYVLTQSETNQHIINQIDEIISNIHIDFFKKNRRVKTNKCKESKIVTKWSFCRETGFGSQRRRGIFHLEPYIKKDGTNLFWNLNEFQFENFLHGLWLGDGNHGKVKKDFPRKNITIHSFNKSFVDIMQAVAVCRGYRASIRKYKNGEGSFLYHLTLTKTNIHRLTKYRFSFDENSKDEYVWCAKTDSGNIITRRNGSVTIMGNCTEGLDLPYLDFVCIARPTKSLGLYIQAMGRGLRLFEGKTDCRVIDVFDKIKVTQSRITYSDVKQSGDIDGDMTRSSAIIKEPIPDSLENFPVVLSIDDEKRWTIDDESWFAPAWQIAQNQWVIVWTKRSELVETGEQEYLPFKKEPTSKSLQDNPIIVKHDKFGEGVAFDLAKDSNNKVITFGKPLVMVDFGKKFGTKPIPTWELKKKEAKVEKRNLSNPVKRLCYLMHDMQGEYRVISLKGDKGEFVVTEDITGDKTTVEEIVKMAVTSDDMMQIMNKNARWRTKPASHKQKGLLQKFVRQNKIEDDIDLDSLTMGEASALMDQVNWHGVIQRIFATKHRKNLIGYDAMVEDV